MDDATLTSVLPSIAVFARVAPEHKLRIVTALQARRHVVAMTGDGVNDAPALRKADIGVAMGSGTEVAKEAASMVLTDDNFATIVRAVHEGRAIYDNIVKFVRFQLSTNMGAVLTVFVAPFLGMISPLGPAQILWVAMISDGPPAIALGLDTARAGIMSEPPREPDARILTWRTSRQVALLRCNHGGAKVLLKSCDLGRPRDRYDPRLAGEEPSESDLRRRRVLLLRDVAEEIDQRLVRLCAPRA